MDINDLTVYESPFTKLRIGKDYDGGYIICKIPFIKYDILLAGGIGNDISFEEELVEYYPNIFGYCFDGENFYAPGGLNNPKLKFINKNITAENINNTSNLHDINIIFTNINITTCKCNDSSFRHYYYILLIYNINLYYFESIASSNEINCLFIKYLL